MNEGMAPSGRDAFRPLSQLVLQPVSGKICRRCAQHLDIECLGVGGSGSHQWVVHKGGKGRPRVARHGRSQNRGLGDGVRRHKLFDL